MAASKLRTMRIDLFSQRRLAIAGALLFLAPLPARAAIVGLLESPDFVASGVSNVQGWAYTTTPGAHLIQPFDVLVDGVKVAEVPCCSDRGDVQAAHPEAPLRTGFSGVFNWSLVVAEDGGAAAEVPQGDPVPPPGLEPAVLVQVVVGDDAGGSLVLSKIAFPAQAGFDFNQRVSWSLSGPIAAVGGALGVEPALTNCSIANRSLLAEGGAALVCDHMVFEAPDGTIRICENLVRFGWDRASQSFRLTSDCFIAP